jgi:hypothetical protein
MGCLHTCLQCTMVVLCMGESLALLSSFVSIANLAVNLAVFFFIGRMEISLFL